MITPVLSISPEESPSASFAVFSAVEATSPVCLADSRDPFVSRRDQAGADLGHAVFWAALACASQAAESFQAGPVAG